MLKLFFVIAILTALVKSEDGLDEIGWICPSINQWGNCSYPPNVPQLLRMMEVDSKTNRYSDIYFCPYNIVKRHAICIQTFYQSCFEHFTDGDRIFFSTNLPKIDDEPSFCTTDRAYKKEFIEHMNCMRVLVKSNDQMEVPFKQLEQYMEQDMLKYNRMKLLMEELKNDNIDGIESLNDRFDRIKCQYFKQYMQLQYTKMRSVCGSKTEKFFRQLFGNIWPMSVIPKNCDGDLLHNKS